MLHHIYALLPTNQLRTQLLSNLTEKWRDYILALYEDSIRDGESGMLITLNCNFFSTCNHMF